MNIFERIKRFNLPPGEYAVFGSALLDVWGIRRAADLDIIAIPEVYDELKREGWEEIQANGFSMLVKNDANVTTVQDTPTDGDYCPDRVQLIRDAVYIEEVPFVRIEEVLACKSAYNRLKDIEDIKAIKEYMAYCKKDELYSPLSG